MGLVIRFSSTLTVSVTVSGQLFGELSKIIVKHESGCERRCFSRSDNPENLQSGDLDLWPRLGLCRDAFQSRSKYFLRSVVNCSKSKENEEEMGPSAKSDDVPELHPWFQVASLVSSFRLQYFSWMVVLFYLVIDSLSKPGGQIRSEYNPFIDSFLRLCYCEF